MNFVLLIIVDLFFYLSTIATIKVIFNHVDTIGPWNEDAFLFFLFFVLAINQLHMSLFAMSFWKFSADLRLGMLDFWLVKPAGILFTVFFRHIRVASLLLFPIPWGGMIYFGSRVGLSPLDWILIPLFVILALTLLVSLEILLSSAMFYTIESVGINFIRMQLQSISRWPDFVYQQIFKRIFSFGFPILLITSAPSHFLLDTGSAILPLIMVAMIGFIWYLISVMWKIGLRRYESASS